MKKIISAALAAVTALIFVSCSASAPAVIDPQAAAEKIVGETVFRDTLEALETDAVIYYYGDEFEGVNCTAYIGSGATAEQVLVFEAADEAGADALCEVLRSHVETEIISFRGYIPEEVPLLEHAVVYKSGKYGALLVCDECVKSNGPLSLVQAALSDK